MSSSKDPEISVSSDFQKNSTEGLRGIDTTYEDRLMFELHMARLREVIIANDLSILRIYNLQNEFMRLLEKHMVNNKVDDGDGKRDKNQKIENQNNQQSTENSMCFYYQKCYDQIGWLRTKLFAALAEIREDASELETLDETQEEDGDRTSTSSELTGNTEESSEAIGHQRKLLTDEKATRLHNEELSRPTASTGFKNFYCSTEERMELQRKLMDSHLSLGFANIKREEVRKKLQNQFRSRVDLCWLKLGSVNRSLHFTEGVLDRLITSSMIHAANLVNSKFHFNILTALTVPPFIWQVCQNIYVQIAIACASDDNILETQPTFPVNDIPEFVGGHWDRAVQETPDLYRGFIGWVKEKKRILNKAKGKKPKEKKPKKKSKK